MSADGMYVYVWEFDVLADRVADFERHYGPDGSWAQLFRRAPGYVGTALLQDRKVANRYVTIDRWRSEAAYRAFRTAFAAGYAQFDAECEALTGAERPLGEYRECGTTP